MSDEIRAMLVKAYNQASTRASLLAQTNVYGKTPEEREEIVKLYNEAMKDAARAAAALDAYDESPPQESTR